MKYYRISELFFSIQGEGLQVGLPMFFIRFAGCNLNCEFCDTKYALYNFKDMNIHQIKEKIVEEIGRNYFEWISFTGGEPLLQDLKTLFKVLKIDMGFKIHLETNGTLYQDLDFDWISLSPKICYKNPLDIYFEISNEIKIVVWEKFTEREVEFVLKMLDRNNRIIPVFLQPDRNRKDFIEKIYAVIFKFKDSRLRLGYQMHRFWNVL